MGNLNKVMLIGRLGGDPELRYTQGNTAIATFSLATDESWTDGAGEKQSRTSWHRIVAWGKLGETISQYLHKGSQAYIEGSIQYREYEDKEGVKKTVSEIKAVTIQFLDSRGQGQGGGQGSGQGSGGRNPKPSQSSEPIPDEDIPF